jgi:hypothetical protein
MDLPRLQLIRDEAQMRRLHEAAAEDGHIPLAATHLILKSNEIVGGVSINGLPSLHVWAHSKKVTARDTFHLLNSAENIMYGMGARQILVPCMADSPYAIAMDRLGFARLGEFQLYLKNL